METFFFFSIRIWAVRICLMLVSLLAAAAKSLQSCPTLCDPIDGSPPGSHPWDSPGKNTGLGCHFPQCMKGKSESEVVQLCLTLSDPMDCSTPGSSATRYLSEFAQIHVHWVSDANHLTLCHPLLLWLSTFPSIRVFSNELALRIRWPNYWNFSFSNNIQT